MSILDYFPTHMVSHRLIISSSWELPMTECCRPLLQLNWKCELKQSTFAYF